MCNNNNEILNRKMNSQSDFKDILIPRRAPFGSITFIARQWNPKKTVEVNSNCTPQDVKHIAANSAFLESVIEAESLSTGTSKEKLKQQVKEYLDQIGLGGSIQLVRWLVTVFLNMSSWMRVGIFVNEPRILALKESMGTHPILILPTHRSYVDVSFMTYLCFQYDIQLPAIAAAMDLSSMAVLGKVLQDTCAFYIRRSLAGATLYEATLRQYVRTLITDYNAPVQFFLEGTRSRSNKSVAPKYGMLSMTLEPLFSKAVDDIVTVPINISYDRLVEHWHFAYEHLGVPKPKETFASFLNALRSVNDHFGNLYINFGEPFSLRDYIKNEFKPEVLSAPAEMLNEQMTAEQYKQVQKIADHTITLQQKYTVTNIANLIAPVLMGSFIKNTPLTLDEVIVEIKWLVDVVTSLGAYVYVNNVVTEVERILVVHSQMMTIDNNRRLRLLASSAMNVPEKIQKKMKGHILKAETMGNAVPIIQLQIYVNPILQYLVPPALVFILVTRGCTSEERLATDWTCVRKLLKYEFFYDERHDIETFKKALQFCKQSNIIAKSDGGVHSLDANEKLQFLLKWTIWPALTTLLKCADVMTELLKCEHKKALRVIQEQIELSECHPYCLSLDVAANCLQGLVLAGALLRHKSEETVYEVVPEVMKECRQLIGAILPNFSVRFGQDNAVILDQRVISRL